MSSKRSSNVWAGASQARSTRPSYQTQFFVFTRNEKDPQPRGRAYVSQQPAVLPTSLSQHPCSQTSDAEPVFSLPCELVFLFLKWLIQIRSSNPFSSGLGGKWEKKITASLHLNLIIIFYNLVKTENSQCTFGTKEVDERQEPRCVGLKDCE